MLCVSAPASDDNESFGHLLVSNYMCLLCLALNDVPCCSLSRNSARFKRHAEFKCLAACTNMLCSCWCLSPISTALCANFVHLLNGKATLEYQWRIIKADIRRQRSYWWINCVESLCNIFEITIHENERGSCCDESFDRPNWCTFSYHRTIQRLLLCLGFEPKDARHPGRPQ